MGIKNAFKSDWRQCIWLKDDQSEDYAEKLYIQIHRIENHLRAIINETLVSFYGTGWWDNYVSAKMKAKYNERSVSYKIIAEDYNNVSDHLMSIDIDDLLKIMLFDHVR